MALNTRTSIVLRNAELNAVNALANSGKLRIYSGTQPDTPEDAIDQNGAAVLLAELTLNATAFGAASGGVITAAAITQDSAADATGTASWFRLWKSDGTTALVDGTCGTASANLILATTSIVQNAIVQVTVFTLTLPMQGT